MAGITVQPMTLGKSTTYVAAKIIYVVYWWHRIMDTWVADTAWWKLQRQPSLKHQSWWLAPEWENIWQLLLRCIYIYIAILSVKRFSVNCLLARCSY